MGDFPTHNCTVTYDGDVLPVVSPMSQLDCTKPRCKNRAEQAELAADMYGLEYIERRIEQIHAAVREALDNRTTWELYREAKLRRLT